MPRRLGRQIGDRRDNFSRQSFFLLAMATKTVAAWSADRYLVLSVYRSFSGKTDSNCFVSFKPIISLLSLTLYNEDCTCTLFTSLKNNLSISCLFQYSNYYLIHSATCNFNKKK